MRTCQRFLIPTKVLVYSITQPFAAQATKNASSHTHDPRFTLKDKLENQRITSGVKQIFKQKFQLIINQWIREFAPADHFLQMEVQLPAEDLSESGSLSLLQTGMNDLLESAILSISVNPFSILLHRNAWHLLLCIECFVIWPPSLFRMASNCVTYVWHRI